MFFIPVYFLLTSLYNRDHPGKDLRVSFSYSIEMRYFIRREY